MHKLFTCHGDAQMADFLETEFLEEQVNAIKEIGDHITNLKRVGTSLGEYIFDKETLDSTEGCPPYFCLKTSLSMISKFAVLIISPKTPPYASAIMKDENKFYIFDPHSKSVDGITCLEGLQF
ncbi:ferritin [Elysia marginata]|uniref:Ferritin n=1 Tax=Elysia marginata TaxID=1093978 RepID=A0AAV4G8T6_9GAST|nr:ferritin [Elysia marginata]